MGPYLALLRRHPAVLAFGFLCGLSSSVGQTFFVSLFVPSVTASFDLDAAGFSSLYALVTVASAITLPFIGPKIDDTDLKRYAALALGALGLACFGMALAPGLLVLVVALYGVRMLGQGLMSHIEVTSTSRYFQRSRGKALALVMLGHPAGEGALPALFTLAIAAWGWRTSWAVAGGVLVAGVLPLVLGLLRGKDTAPLAFVAPDDAREPRPAAA